MAIKWYRIKNKDGTVEYEPHYEPDIQLELIDYFRAEDLD